MEPLTIHLTGISFELTRHAHDSQTSTFIMIELEDLEVEVRGRYLVASASLKRFALA